MSGTEKPGPIDPASVSPTSIDEARRKRTTEIIFRLEVRAVFDSADFEEDKAVLISLLVNEEHQKEFIQQHVENSWFEIKAVELTKGGR
jgi:hypothetical protein